MSDASLRLVSLPLRWLPPGMGQHRVVRRIFDRWLAGSGPRTVEARVGGSARFELDLSDYVQAQAFLTGRNDPSLVRFIAERVGPGETYIDVGAHIGLIAIAVAVRCPDSRVVALEPHPDNAARFSRNLALSPGIDVELINAAAGAELGTANLGTGGAGSDYHRLEEGAAGLSVEVETIDRLCEQRAIERVSVLKLDIEGHEPFALRGAERMLKSGRIGTVVLEANDELLAANGSSAEHLRTDLAGFGYRPTEIRLAGLNRWRSGPTHYENVAFER